MPRSPAPRRGATGTSSSTPTAVSLTPGLSPLRSQPVPVGLGFKPQSKMGQAPRQRERGWRSCPVGEGAGEKTPRACALRGLAIWAQAPERRLGRRDSFWKSARGARSGTAGAGPGTRPPQETLGPSTLTGETPHRVPSATRPRPSHRLSPGEPTQGPPRGHGTTASPRANTNSSLSGNATGRFKSYLLTDLVP